MLEMGIRVKKKEGEKGVKAVGGWVKKKVGGGRIAKQQLRFIIITITCRCQLKGRGLFYRPAQTMQIYPLALKVLAHIHVNTCAIQMQLTRTYLVADYDYFQLEGGFETLYPVLDTHTHTGLSFFPQLHDCSCVSITHRQKI